MTATPRNHDLCVEEATARIADLEHDQVVYREMLQIALAQQHELIKQNRRLTAERNALLTENRQPRGQQPAPPRRVA